ncbi:hypothetical protein LUZ62_070779 [Rhynchospora pubera]|uniref:Uncharacterized protein n=1 Tax=Rhynchospora pubera TaxID=906938 RepID=A0AAV8D0A1_9POAL|nr:hypothetical protein LUZ62_070779 [Rhynchospora pubera]
MESQEATSKLKVGKTTEYRMGSSTELLAIGGNPTTLFVLCGERFDSVQSFRSGDFSVNMVRVNNSSPITMLTCMVGDHQWMLARDSLVASAGERRFIFGLPGFFYGMELGSGELEQKYVTLERIFGRFCAYKDLSQIEDPDDSTKPEDDLWIAAFNKIQKLTNWRSTTFGAPIATPDSTNSDLMQYNKIERAVRTSAVVKLLVRCLLAGALRPSKHIQIEPTNTEMVALPTMWVVSDLLNALETDRTTANREIPGDNDGTPWWRVNVEGVMFLLRIMRAFGARVVTTDPKRKRDDEGSDNSKKEKRGGGSKSELVGGGGMMRPPCGGKSSQVSDLRIGTCGN